ncbi:MAG TPA: hypothetical protein HA266_01200 [Candidatus Poseidoniaceae archaeon]|nr:hypothetical protein [Candidatus Poseidoniaceae archaeon]
MAGGGAITTIESGIIEYAIFIVLLPMLAFPIILFLGHIFNGNQTWVKSAKEGGLIALPIMVASFVLSFLLIVEFIGASQGEYSIGTWLSFGWIKADGMTIDDMAFGVGIYIDHVTVMLLFVASFLCMLINIFSIGYMNTDPVNDNKNHRFYAEFVLFCSGMLGMVLADSFLWLFIFWELMGLCSYLLIGFYYEKPSAAYAAKKASLTTRIGDVFLVIGLVMLWNLFGSLDYSVVFNPDNIALVDAGELQMALGMMFIGAVGKSAQFPLHVWLPDAMEGPTPVSALIHAATMVNAGLYLVARMFPFFSDPSMAGELVDLAFIIAAIGGITAVMAAAIAFVQDDLKKVLAYSTMSQLAYIFTGLGAALWLANTPGKEKYAILAFGAALFHLFNHAMAKGMLFMASGSVIHEMHHAHHDAHHHDDHGDDHHDDHHDDFDAQSMSNMGGLASKMPITATAMLVGSASIMGLPLIGGFWSKEGIIANAWRVALEDPRFFFPAACVLLGAAMTGFYMSRMWLKTFAGKPKTEVAEHVHEQTPWIPIPLVVLTFVSLSSVILAGMMFTHWSSDTSYAFFSDKNFIDGMIYEFEHVFLNPDAFFFVLTYVAIFIGAIVGPGLAMALYGGSLKEGEKAKPWMQPIINLSSRVNKKRGFDNSAWANSGLSDALRERLYFDKWYDAAMLKLVVGFANISAAFDRNVVDGTIKTIESTSQKISTQVRRLTTGSARDYIMMAALGVLVIYLLLGVMI